MISPDAKVGLHYLLAIVPISLGQQRDDTFHSIAMSKYNTSNSEQGVYVPSLVEMS
jgi:hypothetical protein